MAAIDKIYGTEQQRNELYLWVSQNCPQYLRYSYQWNSEWNPKEDHPLTNFPHHADIYIYYHCPIKWVVDYIRNQYGGLPPDAPQNDEPQQVDRAAPKPTPSARPAPSGNPTAVSGAQGGKADRAASQRAKQSLPQGARSKGSGGGRQQKR